MFAAFAIWKYLSFKAQSNRAHSLAGLPIIATIAFLTAAFAISRTTVHAQDSPNNMQSDDTVQIVSWLEADSTLASVLESFSGQFITLSDARMLALNNSTEVHQAEALLRSAKGNVRKERGGFDPTVFAEINRSRLKTPASTPFAGANTLDQKFTDLRTGANMRLRFGTELGFTLSSNRLKSNSSFAVLNPEYSATGRFDIVQPLLAGSWVAAKAPLTAAERVEDAAEARYRDAVLGVIQSVDNTYWDLYSAERNVAVLQLTVEQAKAFLDETKIRAKSGAVGPGDVANATVFYSEQQQVQLDGQENLDRMSNQLATLIGRRPGHGEQRFRASDMPDRPHQPPANVDSLVEAAVDNNYIVKAAQLELEASRALSRGAKWNVLPALDLLGSIGGNGLSGIAQEVVFGSDTLGTDFGGPISQSIDQVFGGDYSTWSVGVRLTLPIGMRSSRGERDRLKAQEIAAQQNLIAAKRSVEEQIRNVLLDYKHAERRLTSAQAGVKAARELVRIGNIEFAANRVSAFEIVRLNADLAAAQQRYSDALVRAVKASSALIRLSGKGFETTMALQ